MMVETYQEYRRITHEAPNKVGAFITMFKDLHEDAPASDLAQLRGRMAGVWKLCQGHIDIPLRIIWCSCALNLKGSHLDYITKAVSMAVKLLPSDNGHKGMNVIGGD